MKTISMSLALCAASLALLGSAASAADLSAAQILERNAVARGGLAAWRAVHAMTLAGDMDAGGKVDARLPFTMSLKRPHMSRLELRFDNQTAIQTYDGKEGWKYRPYLGRTEPEPFTPAELQAEQRNDELDGPLIDAQRKGTRVEMAGREKVEGKDAYRLKLTKANGASRNVWVDASSYLEVKMDGEPRKLDGRTHKVAVFFRDYSKVDGLNIAHLLETAVEGVRQTRKIVIKSVVINPKLDEAMFGKPQPGDIAAANARAWAQ